MNQADNINNETFIEPENLTNSPQSDQASCPFYSVLPNNNMAIMKLPLLMPAEDKLPEAELSASESVASAPSPDWVAEPDYDKQALESVASAPKQDWVAEPDYDKQALIDDEFNKLLELNEELRSANTNLYEQVEVLKSDLSESQKALQWQKKRSSVAESMLGQQTQELGAAGEQIKSLFQQLETAVQNVQRQESLIENYKSQLEISQQRLAQLERECAKIQTSYNEQSHQMLESETTCRELRSRLMRQQRQTLQFKAALEKCLESPVPSYDSLDGSANKSDDINIWQPRNSKQAQSSFSNAEPIKPWSAEIDSFTNELNYPWGESLLSRPDTSVDAERLVVKHDSDSTSSCTWEFSTSETATPAQDIDSPESHLIDDEPITPKNAPSSNNIDEHLDDVIQMFFAAKPADKKDTDKKEPTTPISEAIATPISNDEKTINPQDAFVERHSPLRDASPMPSSSHQTKTTAYEPEDYWSQVTPFNPVELQPNNFSQDPLNHYTADTNSPSPILYPQRPAKGRKSLASVELPNFRQKKK
jgi:myosin heavy subunit